MKEFDYYVNGDVKIGIWCEDKSNFVCLMFYKIWNIVYL